MQGALALGFGLTLRPGSEPLVARFARRVHGADYNDDIARYARGATWAWTLFFVAMVATPILLFALARIETFSLFVNVWSLPLLGLMFAAEYTARRWILRSVTHVPLWRSFSLYRDEQDDRRRAHSGAHSGDANSGAPSGTPEITPGA